jgi:hypothetical protein
VGGVCALIFVIVGLWWVLVRRQRASRQSAAATGGEVDKAEGEPIHELEEQQKRHHELENPPVELSVK